MKLNADGALARSSTKGGGGVVVRDHNGRFLGGACHFFPFLSDPEEAELRACKRAIDLARELGLPKVILESDCATVVSKLKSEPIDRSVYGPWSRRLRPCFEVFVTKRSGGFVGQLILLPML